MLVAIKKCKFYIIKTKFYKFIIKLKKLNIDPKKIKAIVNQQELSNITELIFFRILQLLLTLYSNIVKEY